MGSITSLHRPSRQAIEDRIVEWLDELMRRYQFAPAFLKEFEQRVVQIFERSLEAGDSRVRYDEWPEATVLSPETLAAARPLLERLAREERTSAMVGVILRAAMPEAFEHVSTMFGAPPQRDSPDEPPGAA